MKIRLLLLTILFLSANLFAQTKELAKADKEFDAFNYRKALELYLDIAKDMGEVYYPIRRIADCYNKLGDTDKAIEYYIKAVLFPDVEMDTYYLLSQELQKAERYDEANSFYEKYLELSDGKNEGLKVTKKDEFRFMKDDSRFNVFSLPINTSFSEIGPQIFENQLVFASNKTGYSAVKRSDVRDDGGFYNIYDAYIQSLTNLAKPKEYSKKLNTRLNDGPVSFNNEGNLALVTRNVTSGNKAYLNVFLHDRKKGDWNRNGYLIPIEANQSSQMHAFMNNDDSKIYFVSDMEGGFGGFDIYVAEFRKGFLSTPVNLGPTVNSEGNELFPFIDKEGRLFYTSDKVGGLGGLDIYMTIPNQGGFSQSFNLGAPINTSYDDMSLVYAKDSLCGYFSSNRPGGKGKDDIYAFEQIKDYNYYFCRGKVVSIQTQKEIEEVIVELFTEEGDLVGSTQTNENGEFSLLVLGKDEELDIHIKKRYYNELKAKIKDIGKKQGQDYIIEVTLEEY